MPPPQTLRGMAGAPATPPPLADCVIVVIDAQQEYLDGGLPLPDAPAVTAVIARVLHAAREQATPIVHVAHRGATGGLFDPAAGGRIISAVAPLDGEAVVEKTLPNAFAHTTLRQEIADLDDPHMVLCGFMTHMCISSTARAALDIGLSSTILRDATATRDLPDPTDPAAPPLAHGVLHAAALAELADRFSIVTDAGALFAQG